MINVRDYDFVQEIKRTKEIKISKKCLMIEFGCTPENRKECYKCEKGACCINHSFKHHTKYHLEEMKKLPARILKNVDSEGNVKFDENGHCSLIQECIKDQNIKPLICTLAPLGFNKSGRLIMKRMAWLRPCPFYKKGGLPAYITMKDCLVQTFGTEIYEIIVKMVNS